MAMRTRTSALCPGGDAAAAVVPSRWAHRCPLSRADL